MFSYHKFDSGPIMIICQALVQVGVPIRLLADSKSQVLVFRKVNYLK